MPFLLSPCCSEHMAAPTVLARLAVDVFVYMALNSLLVPMQSLLVPTTLSSMLHLPGDRPMGPLLWAMARWIALRMTLPRENLALEKLFPLAWCRSVCTCVSSLGQVNGPTRQLLVLSLRLPTWLSIRVVVASTSMDMGTLPEVTALTIVLLDTTGRLWLSSMTLTDRLVSTCIVLSLPHVMWAVHFLNCSVLLSVVVRLWLLLMTSTCTGILLDMQAVRELTCPYHRCGP